MTGAPLTLNKLMGSFAGDIFSAEVARGSIAAAAVEFDQNRFRTRRRRSFLGIDVLGGSPSRPTCTLPNVLAAPVGLPDSSALRALEGAVDFAVDSRRM